MQLPPELFPNAEIFKVSSGQWGAGRSAFARRSMACVEYVKDGLWLSFPKDNCPIGLMPGKKAFNNYGSGSWSSLGFALGLGLRCAVWLPPSVSPPAGWGLSPCGGGWWVSSAPSSVQLSLF